MKEITQIMSVSDDLRLWTDFQEIITTSGYTYRGGGGISSFINSNSNAMSINL